MEQSDDEFASPIFSQAQTGSKRKHTGHTTGEYVTTSELDEGDDEASEGYNEVTDEGRGCGRMTSAVGLLVRLITVLIFVDRQTNIVVDNAGNKPQTIKLESSAGTNSIGGGRTHYINRDLPSVLQEDRKWTKVILPALLVWAGSLGDPWMIPDQDLVRVLCIIISAVDPQYGDLNAIRPGEPIFVLVNQSFYSLVECCAHTSLDRQHSISVCGKATSVPLLLCLWLIFSALRLTKRRIPPLFTRYVMSSWMGLHSYMKTLTLQIRRMLFSHIFYCSSLPMVICVPVLGALISQSSTLRI